MASLKCPAEVSGDSLPAWVLDGFDPRDLPACRRYADAIRFVVGKVAMGQVLDSRRRHGRSGWVPLRWKDAAPLFGRSGTWNKVRRLLLERGVLECDETFTVGEKAKWYRLGPAWRGRGIRRGSIRDRRIAARIKKVEAPQDNRTMWGPEHHHLHRWLRETTVDEDQVRKWTCQRSRSRKQLITAQKVAVIQSGEAPLTVDPYGRVHSPVVNLRRAARQALRIGGSPLAEVDVANAQPLLFGYLVAKVAAGEWTMEQAKEIGEKSNNKNQFGGYLRIGEERRQEEGEEEQSRRSTTRLPNLHLSPCLGALPADLVDYLEVCQQGTFYQAVAEAWGLPCGPGKEKNQIKRLTFKYVLFGRPRPGHRYWEAIRRRWPTVAGVIEEIKAGDQGRAARACQLIESSLMIGGVVERFRVAHPDAAIQTIHDSVLVHPDTVDLAKDTILDVFGAIGLTPRLKVEAADSDPISRPPSPATTSNRA
jgi:hypothetical protein